MQSKEMMIIEVRNPILELLVTVEHATVLTFLAKCRNIWGYEIESITQD